MSSDFDMLGLKSSNSPMFIPGTSFHCSSSCIKKLLLPSHQVLLSIFHDTPTLVPHGVVSVSQYNYENQRIELVCSLFGAMSLVALDQASHLLLVVSRGPSWRVFSWSEKRKEKHIYARYTVNLRSPADGLKGEERRKRYRSSFSTKSYMSFMP